MKLVCGLPPGDIPLALLSFNIGVELGQLAFIGTLLGTVWFARRVGSRSSSSGASLRLRRMPSAR
jgi:hypothetical protein